MRKKYSIPIGIAVLAAISILSTSYIPVESKADSFWPDPGHYEVSVKGKKELVLQGRVNMKSTTGQDLKKDKLTTWCFTLQDEENNIDHSFNLYIADRKNSTSVEQGNYLISENINGFINEFQGVFGVADISELGELPFFSKRGQIAISHKDQGRLTGQLQLTLSNALGEIIEVQGRFVAPQLQ